MSWIFIFAVFCRMPKNSQGFNYDHVFVIPGEGCGITKQIKSISKLPPGQINFNELGCTSVTYEVYQLYLNQIKKWVPTSEWSQCSVSCAGGTKSRSRECRTPILLLDPSECSEGSIVETWQCNNQQCPIDGGWGNYSPFGNCSVTCGNGTQSRYRNCTNPPPAFGGAYCVGSNADTKICSTGIPCPVNGGWSNYIILGSCSVTCGNGTQNLSRTCTNPSPAYGGANCSGNSTNTQICSLASCRVDGGWSNYTIFGSCSATCANGTQNRSRTCTVPAPSGGGANCPGNDTDTKSCATGVVCMDLLLVLGGVYQNQTVELIDLSAANKTCPQITNLPYAVENLVGTYIGGKALTCGGIQINTFLSTQSCYYLNPSLNWIAIAALMISNRANPGAVQLSPTKWWLTGGYNGMGFVATTEIYSTSGTFSASTSIPAAIYGHSLVQINSTHTMLLAGYYNGGPIKNAWMFNSTLNVWTPMQNLSVARTMAQAGLVMYPDGHQAVVITGGATATGGNTNSTEIFDLDVQAWRAGPVLPNLTSGGTSVPYGSTFLIVGGSATNGIGFRIIYKFDPASEAWVALPQTLAADRTNGTAFLIPNGFVTCT